MRRISQFFVFPFATNSVPRQRAFSLHEALVVLVVVGVLAAIVLPVHQKLVASQRMVGAVNSLITALHQARSESITRRVPTVLCPSPDGRTCRGGTVGETIWEEGYLIFVDRNANSDVDGDDVIIRRFEASRGLLIRSSAQRDHVTYRPNGMTTGTNLTVRFCDMAGQSTPRAVIVSNSGRPRVSLLDANGSAISCPTVS